MLRNVVHRPGKRSLKKATSGRRRLALDLTGLWMALAYQAHAYRPIRRKPTWPIGRKSLADQAHAEPPHDQPPPVCWSANGLTLFHSYNFS